MKKCILPGALAILLLVGCVHQERAQVAAPAAYPAAQTTSRSLLFPPQTQPLSAGDFQRLINATLQTANYDICTPEQTGPHARTCPVKITVTFEGDKCVANARDMKVPAGVRILWQVNGGAWDFAANGVDFKDPGAAANAFNGHSAGPGAVYFWDVLPNPMRGSYGYSIHLKEHNGNRTCDVDPAIWI